MICARCKRVLKRAPIYVGSTPHGPRCAQIVIGHVPRARRADAGEVYVDPRQTDLFKGAAA